MILSKYSYAGNAEAADAFVAKYLPSKLVHLRYARSADT